MVGLVAIYLALTLSVPLLVGESLPAAPGGPLVSQPHRLFDGEPVAEHPAKPHDFWKLESEQAGAITVTTFAARAAANKGQALLMCAQWPKTEEPPADLEPTVVLGSLYSDLKEFQLLGSKDVTWGAQPARLVAFKAVVGTRPVVGRALMAQPPSGTELLLLVANHGVQQQFAKEFERMQRHWRFGGAAASNVLYSH